MSYLRANYPYDIVLYVHIHGHSHMETFTHWENLRVQNVIHWLKLTQFQETERDSL